MRSFMLVGAIAGVLVAVGCGDQTTTVPPSDPQARDGVTMRSIEEFVAAQGTFCIPDGGGGCVLFVPPLDNFIGWTDPDNGYAASVDYAGIANAWLEENSGGVVSLGTTFHGTVREMRLPDGRAEITVNLHTTNALSWIAAEFDFNGTLLFGKRVEAILAGATPAIGSSHLRVRFTNPEPGAPLPDLMQLLVAPEPGQDFLEVGFQSNSSGELRAAFGVPDGTAGRSNIAERGLFDIPGQGNGVGDGFPVENIKLRQVGHVPMP